MAVAERGRGPATLTALLASVPISVLAVRIRIEEQLLRRELKGYDLYTQRVRYRLVPLLR